MGIRSAWGCGLMWRWAGQMVCTKNIHKGVQWCENCFRSILVMWNRKKIFVCVCFLVPIWSCESDSGTEGTVCVIGLKSSTLIIAIIAPVLADNLVLSLALHSPYHKQYANTHTHTYTDHCQMCCVQQSLLWFMRLTWTNQYWGTEMCPEKIHTHTNTHRCIHKYTLCFTGCKHDFFFSHTHTFFITLFQKFMYTQ